VREGAAAGQNPSPAGCSVSLVAPHTGTLARPSENADNGVIERSITAITILTRIAIIR
jgi:hypothetical protein